VFISYDETLVSGYIIGSSAVKSTQEPNAVQFQFTMFLTGYTNFSDIGNGTAAPARARGLARKTSVGGSESYEFSVQSPNELQPGQVITGNVTNNRVEPPSLFDGITSGIREVMNTWTRAQAVVNNTAKQLGNLAKGDILRVPYGFEGAMAYDEADIRRAPMEPTAAYGVVKYSEFKDNIDEYVGSSTHYGSSMSERALSLSQDLTSQTRNQELVNQAKAAWLAAGFDLPPDSEAEVASFIIKNGVGIIPVGNTAVWQVAETANTGLTAINMTPKEAARTVSPIPVPE
jgi:hypothetical protein